MAENKQISFKIPPEDYEELKNMAKENLITVTALVKLQIARILNQKGGDSD